MKRRDFLKTSTATISAPMIVSSRVFGAYAPSNRINVGFIGLGNQSTIDLPAFINNPDVQVLAVCDVNTASGGYRDEKQFLGRKVGQETVNDHYARQTESGTYNGCDAYVDFREMLARDDIDAVVLVVPDHWHSIMTVLAARAGKDIYCEKPLSLTVRDGQDMVRAVREHDRILQTGSHHRAGAAARQACELVRSGRIGTLDRIETVLPQNNAVSPPPGWQPMPVPEGFDYDLWLGPAPEVPYHKDRCLYRFRFIRDYSGGQVTNFGAHSLDIAQLGNDSERTGPIEFENTGAQWPEPGSLFSTATHVAFRAQYANGVELTCTTSGKESYTRFWGSGGWVQYHTRGTLSHSDNVDPKLGPNDVQLPRANPDRTENLPRSYIADHVRNFIDSVKSRQDPIEPVEVGHRTASICHLGNIAMQLDRKISWNPEAEQIVGDEEASALLSKPVRSLWQVHGER